MAARGVDMTKSLAIKQRAPYDPGLFQVCRPVIDISNDKDWIVELVRIVLLEGIEGLSANQAGINKRVFVTNVRGDGIRIYINPILTIIDYDQHLVEESCHSYPRSTARRFRHNHVSLDALRFSGEREITDTTEDKYDPVVAIALAARIQHEMEHLRGINVREEPRLI